jgi:hypothetical protein
VYIIVDHTSPTLAITNINDGDLFNFKNLTVRWYSDDNGTIPSSHWVNVDGVGWMKTGSNQYHQFSVPENGEHIVTVKAVDHAGNEVESSVSFFIDTKKPTILSYFPKEEIIPVDTKITVQFSEEMSPGSVEILCPSVPGTTICYGNRAVFSPDTNLNYNTTLNFFIKGKDLAGNELSETSLFFITEDKAWISGIIKIWNEVNPNHLELTINGQYVPFDEETGEFNLCTTSGVHRLKLYHKDKIVSKKWIELEPGETEDLGEISYVPVENNDEKGIPSGFYIFIILALLTFGVLGLMIYVKWFIPKDAIINEE